MNLSLRGWFRGVLSRIGLPLVAGVFLGQGAWAATIVPPRDRIDDVAARQTLARLLSYDDATLPQAEREYRVVLKGMPRSGLLWSELADVLLRQRRFDESATAFESAAAAGFKPAESWAKAAASWFYAGDKEKALALSANALAKDSNSIEIRRQRARILVWTSRHAEALPLLATLRTLSPDDKETALLTVAALAGAGQGRQAWELARELLAAYPDDAPVLESAADAAAALGRAEVCRDLAERAAKLARTGTSDSLRQADRFNLWGDFPKAEAAYRAYIAQHGRDREVTLRLAKTLASSERYAEAEAVYQELLAADPADLDSLAAMARLRLEEKKADQALEYANRLLQLAPNDRRALEAKAQSLVLQGNLEAAMAIRQYLAERPGATERDAVALADLLLKLGRNAKARSTLQHTLKQSPGNSIAGFLLARLAGDEETFLHHVSETEPDPAKLSELAAFVATEGRHAWAAALYKAALHRDPAFFPAAMGQVLALGSDNRYPEALTSLQALETEFPNSFKILLTKARILAWSRNYEESLVQYERLMALTDSPVPLVEAARTTMWGKMPGNAASYYDKLGAWGVETEAAAQRIRRESQQERQAKMLAWNGRRLAALSAYDMVLADNPGNQEALFDKAQLDCSLGLCDKEQEVYRKLLTLDPGHTLAAEALRRSELKQHPAATAGFSFWDEDGKGGRLAKISRTRFDAGMEVPLKDRFLLSVTQRFWIESPKASSDESSSNSTSGNTSGSSAATDQTFKPTGVASRAGSYFAQGQSLGLAGKLSEYLDFGGEFTFKQYEEAKLGNKPLGRIRVEVNLQDYALLGLGYNRDEELYNDLTLFHDIRSDTVTMDIFSRLARRFEFKFQSRIKEYSDDNTMLHLRADAGVILTDHPHEIKLVLTGEHRNTREASIYHYTDGAFMGITHPYWTPQKYFAGTATLEWRHDLADFFYCGARKHYYDIKVSAGTDTDNNAGVRVELAYVYDFRDNWSASLRGLIQRSQKWDANGAWINILYRF